MLCATARNFRGKPQERLFFMMLPAVAMGLALRKPGTETSDALAKRLIDFPADAGLSDLDVPSWALKEFRRTSPWTMLQGVNAIGQFSSHRWIGDIDVPTAVVVTTKDRFIPTGRQLGSPSSSPAPPPTCARRTTPPASSPPTSSPRVERTVDCVTSRL